jgi:4-hydroxy-tetrahydrodipicolinate synthase
LHGCSTRAPTASSWAWSLRLSSEERDSLAAAICEFGAGLGTVTTSVGAESLHTAIRHARHAERAGATAVMAIPPVATSASDDEVFRYYTGLLDAITIPVVIQDASGYLGRSLAIEVQARLFHEHGDRALFKPEAQPIGQRLSALRDATDGKASVYEGTGGLGLVDSFRRGVAGTMPGPDVVWALVALWNALQSGDEARVAAIHGPLCAMVSIQTSLDAFVAIQKHLLQRQGVLPGTLSRGPVGFVLDDETRTEVDRLFDQLQRATFAVGWPT